VKQIYADNKSILSLGRRGEDLARQVVFDVTEWQSLYGPGVAELIYRRPCDDRPHVMEIEQKGTLALWTITDWHTATSEGEGECELRYYPVEGTVKSKTWRTYVEKAMDTPSEEDPPDPEVGWVESVLQASAETKGSAAASATRAEAAATRAEEAAKRAEAAGGGGSADAVLYTPQTLTDDQKAQARKNIGVDEIRPGVEFETDETLIMENGVLRVNTADEVGDSTLPITAAAVNVTVGNIEALLETI
jgi:hypothetical protein